MGDPPDPVSGSDSAEDAPAPAPRGAVNRPQRADRPSNIYGLLYEAMQLFERILESKSKRNEAIIVFWAIAGPIAVFALDALSWLAPLSLPDGSGRWGYLAVMAAIALGVIVKVALRGAGGRGARGKRQTTDATAPPIVSDEESDEPGDTT